MCGIVGVRGPQDETQFSSVVTHLHHRGPDEGGEYVSDGIKLGMRRLSIIDLDTGGQPLYNEDESVTVICNGELYNYVELREWLEDQGHRFITDSDVEVIPHLYEEVGPGFPEELNGMFAYALWDDDENELHVGRDRMGIKPLYIARDEARFAFSSELKPLIELGWTGVDRQALREYFQLGYVPAPNSLLEGAQKVRPGERLVVGSDGVSRHRYWSLPEESNRVQDPVARVRSLLEDSVRMRLRADVPVGAFLSGGLDSSSVVGLASRFRDEAINTYSIGFPGYESDETGYAEYAADHFGTNHTTIDVDDDLLGVLPELVRYFDEPMEDFASLPTYVMAKRAREDVKVVLTGSGADELFGGYSRYYRDMNYRQKMQRVPRPLVKAGDRAAGLLDDSSRIYRYMKFFTSKGFDEAESYVYEVCEGEKMDVEKLMDAEGTSDEPIRRRVQECVVPGDYLKTMLTYDLRYFLPDDLLVKVDRSTMATSLEARVPFLDHNLVELVYAFPTEQKLRGRPKEILRQAMGDVLPKRITDREKSGFGMSNLVQDWFKNDPPLIEEKLSPGRLSDVPYVDPDYVQELRRRHKNEWSPHKHISSYHKELSRVLFYVLWYEEFLEGR